METRILLFDFAQQLRRETADSPELYFTWRRWYICETPILNQNVIAKERGRWVPFPDIFVRNC